MVSRDLAEQMERLAESGWSALESGEWLEAEQAYDSAMRLARELKEPLREALFRSYRGEARRGQNRLHDAQLDIEHALAVAQSEGSLQLVAHAQFLLSELDSDAGDDSKAVDRLMSALNAALECQDETTTEVAFGKLGLMFFRRGQLEAASDCFQQALDARPGSPNEAAWLGNLGQTLAEMGMLPESMEMYKRALDLAISTGDICAQAKCYASEGLNHFQQEDYPKAVECYQQALLLAQQENDLHGKSTWLGNLGNVYLRLGQAAKASEFAEEGLKLAKALDDKHSEAAHLDTLGDCCLEQGHVEKALSHFKNALEIGISISDKLGERVYLSNVARAYKRMGDTEKALDYFYKAIELFDLQRSYIKSDHKISFAATGQNLYRDTIHTCLESGRRIEALEYVGRAKSRAILDLLRNSPIDITELDSGNDSSITRLMTRERELSQQIGRLERIYWQGPLDTESGHRGATVSAEDAPKLYSEWRDVVDQLRRRHPNYASMVAVDSLGFEGLCQLWSGPRPSLPKETAIIEFFVSESYLLSAAVYAGCKQPEQSLIADPKELAGLLNDISDFLEMSSTEGWEVPVSLCKRLYQRLLGTIGPSLPENINNLIIVPHGVLHKLPFAALHDGGGYLIERYSLSYLPTASLIPVLSGTPSHNETVESLGYLVSAISDYSATRSDGIVFSSRLRSAAGLEDLGYTLEEGKTVFKLASQNITQSKLLTNEEVKDGLLNLFGDYPVVHFAGHAVFFPEEPMASGLVLSDGSILTAARILQENALRTKCGKLLVLSACQTGVNVITNGGEILGLARALMYAGMPNLILSLWEVADRSTAELMQSFHNSWQAGKTSIAEALAAAQCAAAREGQPVHAWAPFIHLGID